MVNLGEAVSVVIVIIITTSLALLYFALLLLVRSIIHLPSFHFIFSCLVFVSLVKIIDSGFGACLYVCMQKGIVCISSVAFVLGTVSVTRGLKGVLCLFYLFLFLQDSRFL